MTEPAEPAEPPTVSGTGDRMVLRHVPAGGALLAAGPGEGTPAPGFSHEFPREFPPATPGRTPAPGRRAVRPRDHVLRDVSTDAGGELPDEVLARRAGLGDKTAFAALVQRHGPNLYRLLIRMLDDHSAVDDCLQETLFAAWRSLHSFRGEAGVRTWLFTIARRQAYAHVRRVPQSGSMPYVDPAEVLEQIADLRADPAGTSLDGALLKAIDVALKLLPEQQRSAWILKEVEGLTYAEIATVLDVSPTTVRGLLARGRATLAETLEEWR